MTRNSHREYGTARKTDRDAQNGIRRDLEFHGLLGWDNWRDALFLGLQPKRKISRLFLCLSEIAGFTPISDSRAFIGKQNHKDLVLNGSGRAGVWERQGSGAGVCVCVVGGNVNPARLRPNCGAADSS